MKSRRSRIAHIKFHLIPQEGQSVRRKAYTGHSPITGEEWKRARLRFDFTQREFGAVLDAHWNSVARWEQDEMEFPHPQMAHLAIVQLAEDLREGRYILSERIPISAVEWRLYREGLGVGLTEFGKALDANASTVANWEGSITVFPHPNMARFVIRRLYYERGILLPIRSAERSR